ncbi:DUF6734 family protein [Echinicola sp. 20G]|uniref:DUF6734 family protein n=1 Tax=Echinicola sp. 20G TaxID=2781961 RepID=UPI001910AD97|nr:DUF6734 family protein [Echinicola sp. 20G]
MKSAPRIIFSLDVHPLINNRWYMGNRLKETIYMTALSVLYAHMWYRDIELYVDDLAYQFLYMLPCRVTRLDVKPDKDIWMKSKIECIEQQTEPFVHLDTDVFIKRKIDFDFDKVLLERQEGGYRIHYKRQVDFFNHYTQDIKHWHPDLGHTFSCGVLGFNDLSLKNKFIEAFYQLERIYNLQKEDFAKLKKSGQEPCILIEQYNLACLLNHYGIKPDILLKGRNIKEHGKYAEQMGYSHLFGIKKYRENIVKEIEYRLFKIFPYWYAQVKIALENAGVMTQHNPLSKDQVA